MEDSATAPTVPVVVKKPAKKPPKASKKRRLQLYFDEEVRKRLEHYTIEQNVTMSDYVNELVGTHCPKTKKWG